MKKRSKKKKNNLIKETSLQVFFFDQLQKINQLSNNPLSKETIYYSSNVLDAFSKPKKYFDVENGKNSDKILGIKLLESESMSKTKKKHALKDIGDSALFISGFFEESFNRKIYDAKYYHELGKLAYKRLNGLVPEYLGIPTFYESLANSFTSITNFFRIIASKEQEQKENSDLITIYLADHKKIKAS